MISLFREQPSEDTLVPRIGGNPVNALMHQGAHGFQGLQILGRGLAEVLERGRIARHGEGTLAERDLSIGHLRLKQDVGLLLLYGIGQEVLLPIGEGRLPEIKRNEVPLHLLADFFPLHFQVDHRGILPHGGLNGERRGAAFAQRRARSGGQEAAEGGRQTEIARLHRAYSSEVTGSTWRKFLYVPG